EFTLGVERRIRLGDRELAFLDCRQIIDVSGDLAVLYTTVRRLEEAVLVGARVDGQVGDQTDVRPFRRLDRTHTAVVRRVHVAHLKSRTLARQTTRAKGRN